MFNGICHFSHWGSQGDFGLWGWTGMILIMVFWTVLIAALTTLVVRAIRRARVLAAVVPYTTGQPIAKENLQARYARGEITREQYELKKKILGKTTN